MEKLFNDIISNRVYNVLETIHKTYPDKFKKNDIKKEYEILMKHIKLYETECDLIKSKTLPNKETSSKIKNNIIVNTSGKVKNIKSFVEDINKCNARVWNDYIYSLKTNNKVYKLEKEFMVSDYNRLDVDEFLKIYKIGNRCRNKKVGESKYCHIHSEHLIHGDYFIKPSKEICFHYIKDAKFY